MSAPPGGFFGREDDLAAIDRLLDGDDALVTLVGAAGTGKTRLAARWAELHADDFDGGVFFCDLAEARAVDAVASVVAASIGVKVGTDPVVDVGAALAGRGATVLLLDDAESALDAVRSVVERWRKVAREARFLVTSRARLGVGGERVHDLGPLSEAEARAMLLDRASALDRGARLEADPQLVGEIVRAVDALPLCLELVAARLRVLSPRALLERLARPLDVLSRGPLRTALEEAWSSSIERERAALAYASVFHGGFDLGALEAIADRAPLLDDVHALHDRSLLRTLELDDGDLRFSTYAVIRDFAAEKLAERGDVEAARLRHAQFYAGISSENHIAVAREMDNLVAAHAHACAMHTPLGATLAVRIALAAAPLLHARGPASLHLRLLEEALGHPHAREVDAATRAHALLERARARHGHADFQGAESDLEAATVLGDERVHARALHRRGMLEYARGRAAEAKQRYEEAIVRARAANDPSCEGESLGDLATTERDLGDLDAARRRCEEALDVLRRAGDRRLLAFHTGDLGALLHVRGELDAARTHTDEAIRIFTELGEKRFLGLFHASRGLVSQEVGDLDGALASFERGLELEIEVGARSFEAYLLALIARVHHERGDLTGADRRYVEARARLHDIGLPQLEGLFGAAHGALFAESNRLDEAERAFADAEANLRIVDDRLRLVALDVHRAQLDRARGDVAAFESRRERGRSFAHRSDDVRFALRLLARARPRCIAPPAPAPEGTLVVARDASWLVAADGDRRAIDLSRRRSVRLVFAALVRRRLDAPGSIVTTADLFEAGWPGERALPRAAANRVRVTISTLRAYGVRDVLLARDGGYLLDPATPIELRADD